MDDIHEKLSGSRYFSTLDLKSGYWQIAVHPEDIEITAFSTHNVHFEFLRLPFGLKKAPADFNQLMRQVFANEPYAEIYFDDIIIHSKEKIKKR